MACNGNKVDVTCRNATFFSTFCAHVIFTMLVWDDLMKISGHMIHQSNPHEMLFSSILITFIVKANAKKI